MKIDRTQRSSQFNTQNNFDIGPGSYSIEKVPRKLIKSSIPKAPMFRTHKQTRLRKKNKGCIRADFEEGDTTSEEGEQPGPGEYIQQENMNSFGYDNFVHDHPEQFGRQEQRF